MGISTLDKGKISICSQNGLESSCGNQMAKAGISVCLTDSDSQKPMSQVINWTLEFSDEIVRIRYPKFESSGKNVEILFVFNVNIMPYHSHLSKTKRFV